MAGIRRTRFVLALLAAEAMACLVLAVLGAGDGAGAEPGSRTALREAVMELQLTDLALWSGPAYCRHPSQADLFTPFSDHPGALEHFPAGSLVPPPADLVRRSVRGSDRHGLEPPPARTEESGAPAGRAPEGAP